MNYYDWEWAEFSELAGKTITSIEGMEVDGNDVMAVNKASMEAVQNARDGKGPMILECRTYRIKGHHALDPATYRSEEEVDAWKTEEKDPILRFKKQLLEKNVLTQSGADDLEASIKNTIEGAVKF